MNKCCILYDALKQIIKSKLYLKMKNSYIKSSGILALLVMFSFMSNAQEKETLNPCGTPPVKSEWLKRYQQNPDQYEVRNGEILYVPITVALVRNNDGSLSFSETTLLKSLCVLNEDFAASDIQFYLDKDVRYIFNSAWATHDHVLDGAEMMFANNYENAINCYVVDNAAGNCGYNLSYAGIVLDQGCIDPGDHTWAHEVGHNLSIPHPFLGWEGGVSHDGSISHNFNNPAPEIVTYDYTYFRDTLYLDTLIIDTAYVEKVDGSNCAFAADGFCDTAPDYLASGWSCDGDSLSFTEQTDPNGEKFFSDATLFMSYANDNCTGRFTDDQISAMRANLLDEKADYLQNQNVPPAVVGDEVVLLSPADGEELYYKDIYLEWEPVENAMYYLIEAGIVNLQIIAFDSIVTTTNATITINDLFLNRDIDWRISAFTSHDFCNTISGRSSFYASDVSSTEDLLDENLISIVPSVLNSGTAFTIKNNSDVILDKIKVFDITGKKMLDQGLHNHTKIETTNWQSGMYIVQLSSADKQVSKKLVVR